MHSVPIALMLGKNTKLKVPSKSLSWLSDIEIGSSVNSTVNGKQIVDSL